MYVRVITFQATRGGRTAWKNPYTRAIRASADSLSPVSFVGLVGEFRENRQGRVTGEAAMFAAYTSSIVESRPAPRGKGNK